MKSQIRRDFLGHLWDKSVVLFALMIPHGRDAIDSRGAAELLGISYKTWLNKGGGTSYDLKPFAEGRKTLLYDRAQVEAVRDGLPLPAWPVGTRKHPGDRLDERDVAAELGVAYETVRKDRKIGRLGEWVEVCGVPHIQRSTLAGAIAARPGRGVGGGRPRKLR
ncbi:hypothetical protein [Streptosporangium subroseum]|uniref:hypothetical protein n=1 Tax=Streptosporangium subroseum TaxID=106412 RepID=UPI00308C48C9|nr:hypothetical protein OHB15_42755 [Streptosporangium subroseum]